MKHWYVLQVAAWTEQKVIAALNDWGMVEAYIPIRRYWKREQRGSKRVRVATESALFPSYVFVKADLSVTGISTILAKSKAIGCLEFDGRQARIPAKLIDLLRAATESGKYDETLEEAQKFAALIDKTVIIKSGALKGFLAVITAKIDDNTLAAVTIGKHGIKTTIPAEPYLDQALKNVA
jgi:transcription antitermination factor NusG